MRLRLGHVDINDNNVSELTAMAEKVATEEKEEMQPVNISVEEGKDVEWISVGDVVEYDANEYNAEEMDSCIQELGTGQKEKAVIAPSTTKENSDKLKIDGSANNSSNA